MKEGDEELTYKLGVGVRCSDGMVISSNCCRSMKVMGWEARGAFEGCFF